MRLYHNLGTLFAKFLNKEEPPREFPLSDFVGMQHELRPCDVILIEGRSRVSDVIRHCTQSPWTHAALYIGRMHDIEDKSLRKFIARHFPDREENPQLVIEGMLGKGTIVSPLKTYELDHMRICRPRGLSHDDAQAVMAYAIKGLGTPYNVRQIFDMMRLMLPWKLLPRRWGSSLFKAGKQEREICTSLLAEAFGSVRFPILPHIQMDDNDEMEIYPKNPRLFTPSDFDYSPYFDIIKYPILNTQTPAYRNLPWTEENIVSNGDNELVKNIDDKNHSK